jgi:signal transduction histidine kinase
VPKQGEVARRPAWPRIRFFRRLVLDVESDFCEHCGATLHVCDHRFHRIQTLQGPVELLRLAGQVFRWQQRLQEAAGIALRLELETDYVDWFPARLRHILDNLLSNALKYRDPAKDEAWVRLPVCASPEGAVVKLLVEQSGGTLTLDSGEGQGTTVVAVLPRYDTTDYLE